MICDLFLFAGGQYHVRVSHCVVWRWMNKVSQASAFDEGGTHTSISAAKASFDDFMKFEDSVGDVVVAQSKRRILELKA